jgi:Domain of unknown function (DUF4114)
MEEIILVPSTVVSSTNETIKVIEVAPVPVLAVVPAPEIVPAPAINVDSNNTGTSALDPTPLAGLLASNDAKVVEVVPVPVPVINPDSNIENNALASTLTSTVDPGILAVDTTGLLGITDLSLIAASNTPSELVTPPVSALLPTVLDVVKLDTTAIGSKFQNLAEGRTIDLSDYTGIALKVDITTEGEAAYTNNIGFYVVEDAIGTIKLSDGTLIKPGDANYAVEAIKNALTNSLQAGKIDSKSGQDITGGRIYAPVVIAQGSLTEFVSNNPTNGGGANDIHAYFNYASANADQVDHFKLLGNNTFGVEDMYGGGDRDFNDLVVNLNVKPV